VAGRERLVSMEHPAAAVKGKRDWRRGCRRIQTRQTILQKKVEDGTIYAFEAAADQDREPSYPFDGFVGCEYRQSIQIWRQRGEEETVTGTNVTPIGANRAT